MTEGHPASLRARILQWVLALWLVAVLFFHLVAQGCPGMPAIGDLAAPLKDLIQQFLSAPYLG